MSLANQVQDFLEPQLLVHHNWRKHASPPNQRKMVCNTLDMSWLQLS